MTNNSPQDVVLRHIELYNDGTPEIYGTERFLEVWADDAVQEFMPSAQFPNGMVYVGNAQIRENHAQVARLWRNRRLDVHDVIASGDRVVVRYTWSAVAAAGLPKVPAGQTLRLECADFFTVNGGLITRMVEIVGPPLLGAGGIP